MEQFPTKGTICKVIHLFADYTGSMIRNEQLQEVRRCFTIAGVLYHNGSNVLRNAIESVFVYALSPLLHKEHSALLPAALRNLRIQHLQSIAI
ncbi:hypothetical protein OL444_03850 [Chitinophaga sp. PC15]|uniref:DUF7674 domain-containing protein n=1 Tax=Chitinophaga nivalis TaxID=2991709 RepID=A0ABT3IV30_9BACT|nr:hypothetical protein [Chitinophaga nivalis]MCW3462563.1 hypothetical protein [Chitinophaga nivalis]MCW3487746.1 hypothetical protein [Chitinophaga nivalis]